MVKERGRSRLRYSCRLLKTGGEEQVRIEIMLHVVIADDEERICRLINLLGHWEEHGMQVAGLAKNGPEALRMISESHTDVLITDIRMPGLDGLQLITKAREINPNICFVIISGYADFSYAQDALRLGVSDYLLKPVGEQALNETLSKIAREITAENEKEDAYELAIQENEENLDRVRGSLLHDLKSGVQREYSVESLRNVNRIEAGRGPLRVFCIISDRKPDEDEGTRRILRSAWENAKRILTAELGEDAADLILREEGECLYGLIQIRRGCEKKTEGSLRRSLNLNYSPLCVEYG